MLRERAPELEVDGEMHGDAALSEVIRERVLPELAPEGRGQPAGHARTSTPPTSPIS